MGTVRLFAIVLLAAGCTSSRRPEVARLERVAPGVVERGAAANLSVEGAGFKQRVIAHLDEPEVASTRGYRLLLSDGTNTLTLDQVTFVSETELHVALPSDAPTGAYEARLFDGWDREVEGVAALEVADRLCTDSAECDDGLSCTADVCERGVCRHPVIAPSCLIGGGCIAGGAQNGECEICDASRSKTAWSKKNAGDACNDGVLCTVNDTCDGAGSCQGTAACAAPPSSCMQPVGACLPTGVCQYTAVTPGTACEDGNSCTTGTTCDPTGACTGGSWTCSSVAPRACLTASTTSGSKMTTFTFDASCSTDDGTSLTARFDFEGDGVFDTAFGPLTASTSYATAGFYSPTVEVRDADSRTGTASLMIAVITAQDEIVVTTAQDENTSGATPMSPGGTGLSLREAINYANAQSSARTITFASAMTISANQIMPSVAIDGSSIWGRPGVVIDFNGAGNGSPCINSDSANGKIAWLEVRGCAAHAIAMKGLNAQLAYCTFDGASVGHSAKFSLDGRFGPGNIVRNFTSSSAFQAKTPGVLIDGNTFSGNDVDIEVLTGSYDTRVRFNTFVDTRVTSVEIPQQCLRTDVSFNTFVRVPNAVTATSASSTEISAWNNIFKDVGCGLSGARGAYVQVSPNLTHPATVPTCFESEAGATPLVADPGFVNPGAGDYRLKPGSPAINAASDVGLDTNGVLPGNFNGSAPDFGAYESPY